MTVTEVQSNGSAKAAAAAILAEQPGIAAKDLAPLIGVKERQARNIRNALRVAEDRNGAAGAVPAAVTDVRGEVSRSVRSNGVAPPAGAHRPGKSSAGAVRLPRRGRQQRDPIKIAATAVVLAVGLAVSYSHIVHLAVLAGAGWWAWVMPLPLDAMALVSLLHLATERRYLIAWAGVLVGAVGSLAANVLAVDPALADMRYVLWGFAALPPIAVIVCGHLLDRGARR